MSANRAARSSDIGAISMMPVPVTRLGCSGASPQATRARSWPGTAACERPGAAIRATIPCAVARLEQVVRAASSARATLWPPPRGSGMFTRFRAAKAAAARHRHMPFCGRPCSRISGAPNPASCADRVMPFPTLRRRVRPALLSPITPDPRVRAGGNSRCRADASAGRPASGQDATAGGPRRAGSRPPGGRDPDTRHGCPRHR
jgi:hypothetical protein